MGPWFCRVASGKASLAGRLSFWWAGWRAAPRRHPGAPGFRNTEPEPLRSAVRSGFRSLAARSIGRYAHAGSLRRLAYSLPATPGRRLCTTLMCGDGRVSLTCGGTLGGPPSAAPSSGWGGCCVGSRLAFRGGPREVTGIEAYPVPLFGPLLFGFGPLLFGLLRRCCPGAVARARLLR